MILDFFSEQNAIAANGGVASTDFPIPAGEEWEIAGFGGSASVSNCEVQLKYSADGGATWTNPYGGPDSRIRVIHLDTATYVSFSERLVFTGGTGRLLRIEFKNYNLTSVAEISAWLNGSRR